MMFYLQAQRRDVGASAALAVVAMPSCLPTGALLRLVGRHRPAFVASAGRKSPRAIWWGGAPLLCLLLLRAFQLSVGASGSGLCRGRVVGFLALLFGRISQRRGLGPQLNPDFLSSAPVCPVVCRTDTPMFCASFELEWGLRQGRGILVLPQGGGSLLFFSVIIHFIIDLYKY